MHYRSDSMTLPCVPYSAIRCILTRRSPHTTLYRLNQPGQHVRLALSPQGNTRMRKSNTTMALQACS